MLCKNLHWFWECKNKEGETLLMSLCSGSSWDLSDLSGFYDWKLSVDLASMLL